MSIIDTANAMKSQQIWMISVENFNFPSPFRKLDLLYFNLLDNSAVQEKKREKEERGEGSPDLHFN